jgi:uncharacterized protein YegJ (DUF2314 family)
MFAAQLDRLASNMRIDPGVIVAVILVVAVWAFVRWRSPRPDFAPLLTSPDDPLMVEALEKARTSLGEFMSLARGENQGALVKLYFVSNSEQVEHLWAELLSVVSDDELQVRLVTPPVTHSGELDRLYTCKVADVEDWQVRDAAGKVHGGFTQRAMFAIAQRDGVKLPRRLLQQKKEYELG